MTRIKRGFVAIRKRKKILKRAKGFRGSHSKQFRTANQQVTKALLYSYIHRRLKKRYFRRLWIRRLNGVLRSRYKNSPYQMRYSKFIHKLHQHNIKFDRKILSQLAIHHPSSLDEIVKQAGN